MAKKTTEASDKAIKSDKEVKTKLLIECKTK